MNFKFCLRVVLLVGSAASLACTASAGEAAKLEGTYCASVHEVGTCLRLTPGGKFEYFLSYGAYDEASEGAWRKSGGDIVLESPAYDKAPRFAFKSAQAMEAGKFEVSVVDSSGHPIQLIDVGVVCDGRRKNAGATGTVDFKIDCSEAPKSIALGYEMYGVGWQTFDVSSHAGAGVSYTFVFDPGDLGKKRFAATHLKIDSDGSLLMTYENSPFRELNGRTFKYRPGQQMP